MLCRSRKKKNKYPSERDRGKENEEEVVVMTENQRWMGGKRLMDREVGEEKNGGALFLLGLQPWPWWDISLVSHHVTTERRATPPNSFNSARRIKNYYRGALKFASSSNSDSGLRRSGTSRTSSGKVENIRQSIVPLPPRYSPLFFKGF